MSRLLLNNNDDVDYEDLKIFKSHNLQYISIIFI